MGTEFMIKLPQKEKGFFMKKLLNKANFALIGIFVTMSAHAAPGGNGLCELILSMKAVFETLRTLTTCRATTRWVCNLNRLGNREKTLVSVFALTALVAVLMHVKRHWNWDFHL